jgi:hypothetical protein
MPLSVIDARLGHTGTTPSKEHSSKSGLGSTGGQCHSRHPFPKLNESAAAGQCDYSYVLGKQREKPAIRTTSPAGVRGMQHNVRRGIHGRSTRL